MNLLRIFRKHTDRQRLLKNYLQSYWGTTPNNLEWYEKALRHKSVLGSGKFCPADCNERLELLGDAVLDTVITEYLFDRLPEADEGTLTKIRARVVNRQTLSEVGLRANLNTVLEARIGSDDSIEKIVGNALEAWLGAIYMDKGFQATRKSVRKYLIEKYLDMDELVQQTSDFKSALIEWAQQEKLKFEFRTFASSEHSEGFICEIHINGTLSAQSSERSKKRAEKQAAKIAFFNLGLHAHVQA